MSRDQHSNPDDSARIEEDAAEWIAMRYAGLSPEHAEAFGQWLAADPRHEAVFRELEQTWAMLDKVGERHPARATAPNPDALAPVEAAPRVRLRRRWLAPVLAAAAAVAIAFLGPWHVAGPQLDYADEASTAVGHLTNLDLPDGTKVRLNTDSRIEVRYTATERRVLLLKGEAHFTVASMPARPFVVEASGMAVRAVGTAFNVRMHDEAVEVLVTHGKVAVLDGSAEPSTQPRPPSADRPFLVAGDRAVIPVVAAERDARSPVAVSRLASQEIERALAWQDRRLEFEAVPLREIVAEFNRYNRHQLAIEDDALAERRFGGSFRADAPDVFVRLLQTRFGLQVEQRAGTTLLREPRS
jgi:transmembrane sensor